MAKCILHVLSQRPSFTGSGVSLDAVVRLAAEAGWDQHVVVGVPCDDPRPSVGGLPRECIHPLRFETGELDFPLPGMSDVMPYRSSRFSELDERQLRAYRAAWREHVAAVVQQCRPDVIHTRHIWLLSALVKDVAPEIPVVNHCHATGLRQMELCPHLAEEVRVGCARNERFCVLHQGHAAALVDKLGVASDRIHVVGAGYREEIFHARDLADESELNIVYAGKYSNAKGLGQLLDAFETLASRRSRIVLHVAGEGAGDEADALRERMANMSPRVTMHGQLGQNELADLLRRCRVFALPSFYEGLPLVLVEAAACGCRIVCTDLPGVRDGLKLLCGVVIDRVPPPRLIGPDVPAVEDLPAFVDNLAATLAAALNKPPPGDPLQATPDLLEAFTWRAVFGRMERVWRELIESV